MIIQETFWNWLAGEGAHQTAERLDHTFLLLTSFFGLATALVILYMQNHTKKQVDAIKIIVNGRQEELLQWSHSLVTILREEGLDVPPIPGAMSESESGNVPESGTQEPRIETSDEQVDPGSPGSEEKYNGTR